MQPPVKGRSRQQEGSSLGPSGAVGCGMSGISAMGVTAGSRGLGALLAVTLNSLISLKSTFQWHPRDPVAREYVQ